MLEASNGPFRLADIMAAPQSLDAVNEHLTAVAADPSTPLDSNLLEKFEAQVTGTTPDPNPRTYHLADASSIESTSKEVIRDAIARISQLLPSLQQDPQPLTTLATKITASPSYTFTDVLNITPAVDFISGLNTEALPFNLVTLALLRKAAASTSDTAIVAGKADIVSSLVRLWLCTRDTEVAEASLDVLWLLLEKDHQQQSGNENATLQDGQGLMWRRVFADRDIYELFFSLCSLRTAGQPGQLSKRDKTVSQARLLDLVLRIAALDFDTVSRSHFPDIESTYGTKDGGLLDFASCRMVDTEDTLVYMTLMQYYANLLSIPPSSSATTATPSSPILDFLISRKVHSTTVSYYTEPSKHSSLEVSFLYPRAADYISKYATHYPRHLLQNPSTIEAILDQTSSALDISPSQWGQNKAPREDLHVLTSLPRVTLLSSSSRTSSPFLKLPTKPANANALASLATIFHGPESDLSLADPSFSASNDDATTSTAEAAAARALYFVYLAHYPNFWSDAVAAAEILSLPENALAAITLMSAVTTSKWAALPTTPASSSARYALPTESQLARLAPSTSGDLPSSGIWALLVPPALNTVLPFLFKPPQGYSNLVGAGRGDPEGNVWKVASARFDVLRKFYARLKVAAEGRDELKEMVASVGKRVAEGAWPAGSDIGGKVDAMEL